MNLSWILIESGNGKTKMVFFNMKSTLMFVMPVLLCKVLSENWDGNRRIQLRGRRCLEKRIHLVKIRIFSLNWVVKLVSKCLQAFQNVLFWNNKCGTHYIISLDTVSIRIMMKWREYIIIVEGKRERLTTLLGSLHWGKKNNNSRIPYSKF